MKTHSSYAFLLFALVLFYPWESHSQSKDEAAHKPPKLVVGIMVDQMRADYINKYWDKLGEDGLKRLVNEGFTFTNNHFDYMPTATGPGHASVYTGTTPAVHGVMGNSWYVRETGKTINVVEVAGYDGVGSEPDSEDDKAPSNLASTTVGDELRLHTNMRSKVIGVSRKDRGAILPAGHTGEAYWYEGGTGNFITSSFYHSELPDWVKTFNSKKLAEEYLKKPWETLLPIEEYIESMEDDNPYERMFGGQDAPVFPYNLPEMAKESGMGVLMSTPFGNDMVLEMGLAAIEGETLGSRNTTDMLAISFSATDAVGHQFGPSSIEVQDTYLRLDRTIAKLLNYLDENFGKDNILLFLTADHAASYVTSYLVDLKISGGYINSGEHAEAIKGFLNKKYGEDLMLTISNSDVFLNRELINEKGLDLPTVQQEVAQFAMTLEGVAGAVPATVLANGEFTEGIRARVQKGYNQRRSGDVSLWLLPQTLSGSNPRGTTHGSPWTYDSHAPMQWYGGQVPVGRSSHPVNISDIASTVATFMNTPFPSGNIGRPMNEFMK